MGDGSNYFIGIDTGGTFTDVTVLDDKGDVYAEKAPTTPGDFSVGVIDALRQAAKMLKISPEALLANAHMVKHGTTVGTNALITREGAKVGLITTKGFEDTTLIMRAIGRVAGLSELEMKHMAVANKPEPIVPRELIRGVFERIDYAGRILVPLNIEEAREAIRYLVEERKVDIIGLNFLWSFANPVHELMVEGMVTEAYGGRVGVTPSHKLAPVIREYARANTVIINAFLEKTMKDYLESLSFKLKGSGFKHDLLVMQANGGIVSTGEVNAISTVSSGPSGGIIASKYIGDLLGHPNIISTDMGGTSFDVGLIIDGHWSYQLDPIVERFHVSIPMIDIESIGAGGGTIISLSSGAKNLQVGPKSAGAAPGPVCYDAGGANPTITDADVILGFLNPDYFLGGRMRLNLEKAKRAMKDKIADPLKMDLVECSAGVYDIINAKMSDLIRKKVVIKGLLPEELVLYAFGGAGPVHATAYASDLGIKKIYIFPTSSVFSAFGIATADIIHTYSTSHRYILPVDPEVLNKELERIERILGEAMRREGFSSDQVQFKRTFMMRYRRQLNEIAISVPVKKFDEGDIKSLIMDNFEKRYEEAYGSGSGYTEAGIEIISFNIDAIGKTLKPSMKKSKKGPPDPSGAIKAHREVFFTNGANKFFKTPIYDYGLLKAGNRLDGPSIVETPITTVVIPPGTCASVDEYMNIEMEIA